MSLERRAARILVGGAFFVSGVAGLVYQVVWQRILALHSGVGIYSVAVIVAAFLAGLGLGSHLGGAASARVSPRRALVLFACLELAIGAFGALSCGLYHDLLYQKLAWLYAPMWRAVLLHLAGLVPPTLLMGMTLPFLTRALVRDVAGAGRTVGFLYATNMLGAALGAWLTPWVLIRLVGMRGATLAAAASNACAAALALSAAWRAGVPDDQGQPAAGPPPSAAGRRPLWLWTSLYALSGFCALSLEILWFRLLDVAVKSTAFTFGTLLAFFLLGSALGCYAGIPWSTRLRRPLRAFLLLQCLLLAYAAAAFVVIGRVPAGTGWLRWYDNYWAGDAIFNVAAESNAAALFRLYLWLPAAVFGPPTLMMGLSFTALQRAVHDDVRSSGRKVGRLQAANIAGCVAGSLLVGLLVLAQIGSTGAIRLLLACGLVFAAVGWRSDVRLFSAAAAGLLALAALLPSREQLWSRLHGSADPKTRIAEDATGVSALVPSADGRFLVYVNGKSHSWIPFGGIHSQLGAVPALVHPYPADVAIIGLGSGDTAWAAACRPETRSLAVFEIMASQPRLLRELSDSEPVPALRGLLHDPRLRLEIADGRHALRREDRRFDLIEADAQRPHTAYSGNLYSVEFFRECGRRLKPDGLMCSWSPTSRVYASFLAAFPHVLRTSAGNVLIGSNQAIPAERRAWLDRLEAPAVAGYLGGAVSAEVRRMLTDLDRASAGEGSPEALLNRDLFPRDEFRSPR